MAAVSIHTGGYELIPDGASPGLAFLKDMLPSYDALGKPPKPVRSFFNNESKVITNSKDVVPIGAVLQGFLKRHERLSKLHHEVLVAYDVAKPDGTHTVIVEGYNVRVLRGSEKEIRVKEVTILELKPGPEGGLVAAEVRATIENQPLLALKAQGA